MVEVRPKRRLNNDKSCTNESYKFFIRNDVSEEDAKIQNINRILNECLGWPYTDFSAETHHENGFSDYILVENEKPVLLIEAKRLGIIGVNTAERNKIRYLKISGTSLQKAKEGYYCVVSYH